MKWLRNIGMGLAGILIAVGLSMIGRDGRRAKKAETREQQHLADGSAKSLGMAKKEKVKKDKFTAQAKDAVERGEAILNRAGDKDEGMASMLDRYHKRV